MVWVAGLGAADGADEPGAALAQVLHRVVRLQHGVREVLHEQEAQHTDLQMDGERGSVTRTPLNTLRGT